MSNVVTTFNTLTAPLIQQYTNYLPNAFDDTLSLLQKVNKVISSLSTTDDTVNNLIDQWNNTVVPYINGDGMQTDVNNKLDEMASDGTLASLINEALSSTTFNLYVDVVNGLDTNDGSTSGTAFKTVQKALDTLYSKASPILLGTWQVNLAEGTYPESVTLYPNLLSQNPIIIQGPNVGTNIVPTAIFSKGSGAVAVGFTSYGSNVLLKNIKFVGYNGSSSSGGVVVAYQGKLTTSNVHTDTCYYGISGEHQAEITIPDGLHTNNGYLNTQTKLQGGGSAIRSLMQTNHYIGNQYATDTSSGFSIQNCSTGVFCQELSTGHINYGTITGCVDGVHALVMSRGNLDGVAFSNNTRDIRVESNAQTFIPTSTTFDGTSQMTIAQMSGGRITGTPLINEYDENYSIDFKTYAINVLNQTVNTNSATILHTSTLNYPHWKTVKSSVTIGRIIKFKIKGVLNGTLNNKRINVRLSDGTNTGLVGVLFSASEIGNFEVDGEIIFNGSGSQYMSMIGNRHLGATTYIERTLATVPMTVSTKITVECQIDDTTQADSVLIDTIQMSYAG